MNNPSPHNGLVEVTQEDRDAVLRYWNDGPAFAGTDAFVASVEDSHLLVQAFARHCLASLTASPTPQDGWRDISTAPKDCEILIWSLDFQDPIIVKWDAKKDDFLETWDGNGGLLPSHWQPLPAPPGSSPTPVLQDELVATARDLSAHLFRMPMTEWVWSDAQRIEALLARITGDRK